MQLVPDSWGTLSEVNHCHGPGRGHPCESSAPLDTLRAEFPDVDLYVYDRSNDYSGKVWYLDTVRVKKELQRQGTGTKVMNRLIELADEHGAMIALSPSGDFGASVPRLKRFYKRFGFIPNKGRYSEPAITGAMIRKRGK